MQLQYPQTSAIFFDAIFGFVTYDMVPTEDIYVLIFNWNNVPYSEEADSSGYHSRWIIENSGSITLFIVLEIVLQLFYSIIKRIFKSGRIHDFVTRR